MPLRLILSAIGDEFRELGEFTERFQLTLSPAVRRLALDEQCHRDVQSLDLLAQRLAALSGYILEISDLLPEDLLLDSRRALASITLSELQYRLKGAPLPQEQGHISGELELF
ncbi:hypothetical protein [Acidocella aminolytica]|uniref:Uncharacterized protein n=1 Tax=Acidocella aminolytica 101 = DSM 11237 TaxID=1120923 RepID=A0A0D6PED9_9PROT|nr:hypothetical protein [Acidocella aminolytica]GAN79219.1 hypothetical protein Aam_018_043 [Acidocella aminolytica 101 = DSM 11237]SHE92212.1 hypothetical protein SAMN02746095_01577 [Acidocella aminolytica 101 = DSM 11237]